MVWQQAAPRFGLSAYVPTGRNLIVNGDFSLDVLNGGFDWQYQKQRSVTLTLDPSDFHGGHRSLLITFDGPGVTRCRHSSIHRRTAQHSLRVLRVLQEWRNRRRRRPHFTIQDAYNRDVLVRQRRTEGGGVSGNPQQENSPPAQRLNCWCCTSGGFRKAVRSVVSSGSTISTSWQNDNK